MKNILMVFAHLLTHSPTYSLTHSLTHSEPGPTGTSPVSRDWGFARYLTKEIGVTPIPPSAFYCDETKHYASNLARFAFCKTDPYLQEARNRLVKLGKK